MSKADLAKNCGFAFQMKYVRKQKGTVPPKDSAGRIGTAAHEALEIFLKGEKTLAHALEIGAINQKLTTVEIDELSAMAHNIVSFRDRLGAYKAKHNVTDTRIEFKFGLRIDNTPTAFFGVKTAAAPAGDVFSRGVMDLILDAEKSYIILDHKTGNPPGDDKEVFRRHDKQLKLYSIAAFALFPDLKGSQSAVHYLQNERIVWAEYKTADEIRDVLIPWYYAYVNEAAEASRSLDAKKGWYCMFCDYSAQCPLVNKRNV